MSGGSWVPDAPLDSVALGQEHAAVHRHRRRGLLPAGQRPGLSARAPVRECRWAAGNGGDQQVVQPEPERRAQRESHLQLRPASDEGTQCTTSGGIQYEDRRLYATQILARTLLPGQESPQQTTSQTVSSRIEPVRDLGIFAQEEVLLANRRLLLTAGVRADRSSANGDTEKFFFYPKVAASYRFVQSLRGSGGDQAARAPTARPVTGRCSEPSSSTDTTGTIGGQFGTYIGNRAGDPTISPSGRRSSRAGSMPRWRTGAPS